MKSSLNQFIENAQKAKGILNISSEINKSDVVSNDTWKGKGAYMEDITTKLTKNANDILESYELNVHTLDEFIDSLNTQVLTFLDFQSMLSIGKTDSSKSILESQINNCLAEFGNTLQNHNITFELEKGLSETTINLLLSLNQNGETVYSTEKYKILSESEQNGLLENTIANFNESITTKQDFDKREILLDEPIPLSVVGNDFHFNGETGRLLYQSKCIVIRKGSNYTYYLIREINDSEQYEVISKPLENINRLSGSEYRSVSKDGKFALLDENGILQTPYVYDNVKVENHKLITLMNSEYSDYKELFERTQGTTHRSRKFVIDSKEGETFGHIKGLKNPTEVVKKAADNRENTTMSLLKGEINRSTLLSSELLHLEKRTHTCILTYLSDNPDATVKTLGDLLDQKDKIIPLSMLKRHEELEIIESLLIE